MVKVLKYSGCIYSAICPSYEKSPQAVTRFNAIIQRHLSTAKQNVKQ